MVKSITLITGDRSCLSDTMHALVASSQLALQLQRRQTSHLDSLTFHVCLPHRLAEDHTGRRHDIPIRIQALAKTEQPSATRFLTAHGPRA